MKIYVDADACPVTRIAERVARDYAIPVVLLCDTNPVLSTDYSEIRVIGAGADAVDIALINLCQRGDIVVTQDYGVAALALGKGAKAIHQSGRWYTDENIDGLLMERHMAKVARRKSKNHRMHPDIAAFCSKKMYRGLLKTAPGILEARQPIADRIPMRGKAIGLYDLSGMMSVCLKPQINPGSTCFQP